VGGVAMRNMVNSTRPSPHFLHVTAQIGGGGFPSGHVMLYATLFGFAFYVVIVAFRRNPFKFVMLAVLALFVILIGPSRVYLGHHWPTDIVGAYLISFLVVAGMIETHLGLLRHFAASREAGERSTLAEALDNRNASVISRDI
jgi:membrane-associated phospholipid phosphatase